MTQEDFPLFISILLFCGMNIAVNLKTGSSVLKLTTLIFIIGSLSAMLFMIIQKALK